MFYSAMFTYDEILTACIRIEITENALTCTFGNVDVNSLRYRFFVQRKFDRLLLTLKNQLAYLIPVEVPTSSSSTTTTTTKKSIPIPSDYPVDVNASGNCVSTINIV